MHIYTLEKIHNSRGYQTVYFSCEETPLGPVWIASTSFGVCKLSLSSPGEQEFLRWLNNTFPQSDFIYDGDRHKPVVQTLSEYAAGQKLDLNLPMHLFGTYFQLRVWQEVLGIPYGETASYKELAGRMNSHPRAVGQANARNPVAILVPCHRVVGDSGKLTGYAGGLDMKSRLLQLETSNKQINCCEPLPSIKL
jgi:O-6-methylguanine DNA methyltransferase